MTLRAKLLLVFIIFGLAPMILLGVVNYVSGTRTVERLLREDTEGRAERMKYGVETTMRAHEAHLSAWANSPEVRAYLQRAAAASSTPPRAQPPVPDNVRAAVSNFLINNQKQFEALTILDREGHPLFRAEAPRNADASDGRTEVRFVTEDIPSSAVRADKRVWETTDARPLRAPVTYEPYGACVRLTIPVFPEEPTRKATGAVVAEMKLGALVAETGESQSAGVGGSESGSSADVESSVNTSTASSEEIVLLALDNPTGRIIYHTNAALRAQSAAGAMPFFEEIAGKMRAGAADGSAFYDAPDGESWLAAFKQVEGLDVSVAAARDYSAARKGVRRAAVLNLVLPLLAGAAAILLLVGTARRATRRIERVAAGAAAIARGDLSQHIDVGTSGETKALAESFNLMSERLREHIAREAETKQFESFMRLSAMLTHDLKNSITGLSMLVNNMEKQFHRAEFRADAIASLRDATDKLRRIVARLNEPVKSLSGEYRRAARETDLVAVIRRVLSTNAEPSVPLYEIETHLPETLSATVEPERIENVVENLVINALEAMGAEGGRLTVEAGALEDGHVFFSVADTGRGMSAEFVESRLFRPFMTTKANGIGLGLFTCREIVETHGGRLEVESQLGVGTRFRVVLPSSLFSSRERQRQPQKGAVAAGRTERGA